MGAQGTAVQQLRCVSYSLLLVLLVLLVLLGVGITGAGQKKGSVKAFWSPSCPHIHAVGALVHQAHTVKIQAAPTVQLLRV